jgi:nitrile hydratase
VIEAYHGAHVLPDAKAHGEDRAEPLYTVVFDAAELWPEAAGRPHRVFLDLWESYLERA